MRRVPMPTLLRPADQAARYLAPLLVGCTIEDVERELIICTLAATRGSRTHTADLLGISVRTLRNRIREYGSMGVPVPSPTTRRPGAGRQGDAASENRLPTSSSTECGATCPSIPAPHWRIPI
jgi:hypothetical protein